ncbi:hypothetical protein [Acidiluteibacter ferrifornacis]|uniref:Uncharacterized protein n=1 Tax=Acidiluteibacter ferrifornacis TaxID=2692424 RepID=A0A6N9NHS3_9FLAO|nr:hypothetical protein [Acidiluteibacter ferrifornacis]MBR9832857.1 hypothetical protein [bacterium]NBG65453.1 hypothetical protein [Acidiluteibacter ferrifornacis]
MGYGGFVNITNKTNDLIRIETTGSKCMNASGTWNEELLAPNNTYPRQYIEASASFFGGCSDTESYLDFVLAKLDVQTGKYIPLGTFQLYERMNNWSVENASTDIQFNTSKPGDQEVINITLT